MDGKAHLCPLCSFFNANKVAKRYRALLQWLNISIQAGTLSSTFTLCIFSRVGPLVCRSGQESFSQFFQFSLFKQAISAGRCGTTA